MATATTMDHGDIQAKYHKLALEYSKVRAQNKVLKAAVVDEQTKTQHVKETLKLKDQTLRKAEQELDSLTFRNQQLAKRLSLLQDDLETLQQTKRNKNDTQNHKSIETLQDSVFAEELRYKIEENACLHARLSDFEQLHSQQSNEMENKYASLKKDLNAKVEQYAKNEDILKENICQLESGQMLLEVTAQQKTIEMRSIQEELLQLQATSLCPSKDVLPRPQLKLNLNSEEQSRKSDKVSMKNFLKDMGQSVSLVSLSFTNILSSYCNLIDQSSSQGHLKLLKDEQEVWKGLAQNYKVFVEANQHNSLAQIVKLALLSKSVTNCAGSLRKILPVLSIKYEFCIDKQDAAWRSSLGRFVSCWASLTPCITALSSLEGKQSESTSRSLSVLGDRLEKMQSAGQELVSSFEIFTSHQPTQANDVYTHLQSLARSLHAISCLYNSKVVVWWNECSPATPSSGSDITPVTVSQPDATVSPASLSGWSQHCGEGVNSEASLAQQLLHATTTLSKLEQQKEHWRLEYQLSCHKYQHDTPASCNETSAESDEAIVLTSAIGELCVSGSEERETEIRNHFTSRCSHLYMQHTATTSQAALYQNECQAIMRRLAFNEEQKSAAESHAEQIRCQMAQLQENLQTTSRNYEEQISTMSEHLADLNDKITTQQDTIEQLLFKQKNKGKK